MIDKIARRSLGHDPNGRRGKLTSDVIGSWNERLTSGFEPMAQPPDGRELCPFCPMLVGHTLPELEWKA